MSIVLLLQIMGHGISGGLFIYIRVWVGGGGDRAWISFYSFCFFLVLLYFVVPRSQSLCLGGYNMMAVVFVSLFFLYFLCPRFEIVVSVV